MLSEVLDTLAKDYFLMEMSILDFTSVFMSAYYWVQDPNVLAGVGQTVLGRAAYDGLKALGESFVAKLGDFFSNKEESEAFYQAISSRMASNPKKPYRDLEDIFEEISTKKIDDSVIKDFLSEIKEWFIENDKAIKQIIISQSIVKSTQNITHQQAVRDINNVQGTQINYNR